MTLDDLKLYVVRVKNGSGCLFQPFSDNTYTYILTAKHLFEGVRKNKDGEDENYSDDDNAEIQIFRTINDNGIWKEVKIPFKIKRGETYFVHNDADVAILKINHIAGFDRIFVTGLPDEVSSYKLNGFPERLSGNNAGNKNTSYQLQSLLGPSQNSYTAQLFSTTLTMGDIAGMSGGGILSIMGDYISIIGVQSEMKHSQWANGQINFVPILYFNQIIEYNENQEKLTKLCPNYLNNFSFLKDDAFLLDVDAIDEDKVEDVRTTLRNKALEVTRSNITPWEIKELFNVRLLVFEKNRDCLSYKPIWIAWLEFLTILNIIKYHCVSKELLSEVFNMYRLKYADVDDWSELEIRKQLGKSDYIGLKPNSTVFVSTRKPPKRQFHFPKGKLIDISRPYDKDGFRTDGGLDPFTSFDFVHLDYFKTKCIIDKIEEYQNMNENELLNKLKEEYHELFK